MNSRAPHRLSRSGAEEARAARSRALFATALVFAACLLLPACSRKPRPGIPPKNLLVITFDDLRPDHLSCYGYMRPTSSRPPVNGIESASLRGTFDSLAASGVMFVSAYSPSSSTVSSLATLFTGRGPLETGVVDDHAMLAEGVPTLAEVLGRAGFATGACITTRRLDSRALPQRGFETVETGADDDATIQHALQWMKRDIGNDRPFFLWLHLSGTVPDWRPKSTEKEWGGPVFPGPFADPAYRGPADGSAVYFQRLAKREIVPSEEDVAHTVDLYDGRIERVMGLVGDFLLQCFAYETSEVEASECWGRTLLVMTSTHGIELYDHGQVRSVPSLNDDVLQVPLVFRHPDSLTGERVFTGPVELQDVMPTVLEWFSLGLPAGVRGRSLLSRTDAPLQRRFEPRPAFASVGDRMFTVRDARWRLIWDPYSAAKLGAPASQSVNLFDHGLDRWEIHDVADENPDRVNELEDEIRAWRKTQVAPVTRAQAAASAPAALAPRTKSTDAGSPAPAPPR